MAFGGAGKPKVTPPPTSDQAEQAAADVATQARLRGQRGYASTQLRGPSLLYQYANALRQQTGQA